MVVHVCSNLKTTRRGRIEREVFPLLGRKANLDEIVNAAHAGYPAETTKTQVLRKMACRTISHPAAVQYWRNWLQQGDHKTSAIPLVTESRKQESMSAAIFESIEPTIQMKTKVRILQIKADGCPRTSSPSPFEPNTVHTPNKLTEPRRQMISLHLCEAEPASGAARVSAGGASIAPPADAGSFGQAGVGPRLPTRISRRGHSSPPPTVRSEGTAWTAAAVSPSEAAAALRESASIMRCGGGQASTQRGPAALTGQQTCFPRLTIQMGQPAALNYGRPSLGFCNSTFRSCHSGLQSQQRRRP